MPFHPTRRGVLGALAEAGFAFDDALAAPLAATPACHDGDEPTVRQTDGPMTASSDASPPLLQSYLRSHAGGHHERVSARWLRPGRNRL